MKILLFIFLFSFSALATEQYYAESATFTISGPNENTYSAESEAFSINLPVMDVYFSESATFLLTGINEIPEPGFIYYLLFISCYLLVKKEE